jgi:cytochrome P450
MPMSTPSVESTSNTPFADASRRTPVVASKALAFTDVPGDSGRLWVGHTFDFLWRTQSMLDEMCEQYGPNFRTRIFGMPILMLGSSDAVREVLLDRDKNFSSERGWHRSIGKLFARGLMLLDFEEHRVDRRIMQAAFRADAMRGYVEQMHAPIHAEVASWPRKLSLYPALKELTLGLASRIFLGLSLDRRSAQINRAFVAAVAASLAIVRYEVPGLGFARGMRGRRALERFFRDLIRQRRAQPGSDLLSELCGARSEEGERFSDRAISDHMIFLMMAAHDTTTSALSSLVRVLLEHPAWQQRVRDEIRARGSAPITWQDRDALPALNRCFDEALRLYPPVPVPARAQACGSRWLMSCTTVT